MRALALAVLGLLGACSTAPTELLLVVQANLASSTLVGVQLAITQDVDASSVEATSPPTCVCVDPSMCATVAPEQSATMPLTIPLEPGHQGTAPFEITVTGHAAPDCSDSEFITATAVAQFVPHKRLGVYVSLDAACVGVECPDGQTCDPDTGECVSNVVMPITVSDMGSTPPVTVVDMAVPSGDMATPLPSTLLTTAPSRWDVALGGGLAALGYIEKTDTTSFRYGILDGTDASMFPAAPLPAAATDVCAVYDELGAKFVFGVATQSTVTMYTTGDATGGFSPRVQVFSTMSGSVSGLQCARSADGVVFAWLSTPVLAGTGANGAPAHDPSTNAPMISLVDIVTGMNMGMPVMSVPTQIAPATSFQLASSGFYTRANQANTVPVSVMFVPDGMTYTNGTKTCTSSVLFTYNTTSFGSPPDVTTCVPLDPAKGLDGVATAGNRAAAVGYKSGKTFFGAASSPLQSISMATAGQLAIVPIASQTFAIAFSAQGSSELDLFEGAIAGTPPLSSVVVSSNVTPSSPVKLASDDAGRTFVTWVEGGALFGQVTP